MKRSRSPVRRNTRQREILHQILLDARGPLSAQMIEAKAVELGHSLGKATVYRGINELLESGELRQVVSPRGGHYFERAREPHHHFQCDRCEEVIDLEPCPSDCQPKRVHGEGLRNAVVRTHEVFYFGLCGRCA